MMVKMTSSSTISSSINEELAMSIVGVEVSGAEGPVLQASSSSTTLVLV